MKVTIHKRLLPYLVVVIILLQAHQIFRAQRMMEGEKGSSIMKDANPFPTSQEQAFSACILISDDNHWLIEWLAYHFYVLPLRYLVVTQDPRSRTSPSEILNRWKHNITIIQWKDEVFLPLSWRNRTIRENDNKGLLQRHRERQRYFYPACFQHLKEAGRSWTMVIDVDEFMLLNADYVNASVMSEPNSSFSDTPTILQSIKESQMHHKESCISVPRLRFGMFEDENSTRRSFLPKSLTTSFTDTDFLTLRWKWSAAKHSRKANKLPKSMVDVSKIHGGFDRQDTDMHRPVRSACPRRNLYTTNMDSKWVIHHYVGSQEQFRFRKDAREGMDSRSQDKLEEYRNIRMNLDEHICRWLGQFVNRVGKDEAKRLLAGVGNVSFSPVFP